MKRLLFVFSHSCGDAGECISSGLFAERADNTYNRENTPQHGKSLIHKTKSIMCVLSCVILMCVKDSH